MTPDSPLWPIQALLVLVFGGVFVWCAFKAFEDWRRVDRLVRETDEYLRNQADAETLAYEEDEDWLG